MSVFLPFLPGSWPCAALSRGVPDGCGPSTLVSSGTAERAKRDSRDTSESSQFLPDDHDDNDDQRYPERGPEDKVAEVCQVHGATRYAVQHRHSQSTQRVGKM